MLSTIPLVILFAQYACCVTILNPLYCSVLFCFPFCGDFIISFIINKLTNELETNIRCAC